MKTGKTELLETSHTLSHYNADLKYTIIHQQVSSEDAFILKLH